MNKKAYLFIMVGCPGSGKSYFLNQKENLLNNSVVVSRDKVRFSIIHENDAYFSKETNVFNEFIKQIQNNLDKGKSVYADATHINGISRLKLMDALNLENIGIIPIVFNTPLNVCLERNNKRSGRARVPKEIIERMYNNWVDPCNDDENMSYHYDDILYIDCKE